MTATKIKTTALVLLIGMIGLTGLIACNTNADGKKAEPDKSAKEGKVVLADTAAYALMKQKCAACHMLKPDPSKRGAMLAPPMIRVKEHYEPSFQTRDEFVDAMGAFVLNPIEEDVLMPGAVRKFKLMPNLGLSEQEAKLIAGVIYDTDFGSIPKMKMENSANINLNDGKKWKLKPDHIAMMSRVNQKLGQFESDKLEDYNQLGKEVFAEVKTILLDKDYNDELVQQLHYFFGRTEGNLHDLQSCKTVEEGKKLVAGLKQKFSKFDTYFE